MVSSIVRPNLVKRTFLPILWFEIGADLPDSLATWLNLALRFPALGKAVLFGLLCASLVSVVIALVRFRAKSSNKVGDIGFKLCDIN